MSRLTIALRSLLKESDPKGFSVDKSKDPMPSGIRTPFWVWASKYPKVGFKKEAEEAPKSDVVATQPDTTPDDKARKILVDNPGINGATLLNTMKASGLEIVDTAQEADASSSNTQFTRAGVNTEGGPGSGRRPEGSELAIDTPEHDIKKGQKKIDKIKKQIADTKAKIAGPSLSSIQKKLDDVRARRAALAKDSAARSERIAALKKQLDDSIAQHGDLTKRAKKETQEGGPGSGRHPEGGGQHEPYKAGMHHDAHADIHDKISKQRRTVASLAQQTNKMFNKDGFKIAHDEYQKAKSTLDDMEKKQFALSRMKDWGSKDVEDYISTAPKKGITISKSGADSLRKIFTKKESARIPLQVRLLESKQADSGIGYTKFRVVLIKEGLGNLKDAFFYSRAALESAVPVFEGKKIFADHPTALEDETRPERSVRDIIGHFENVALVEGDGGVAQLEADAVTMPDEPYRWARALMRHAVEYSEKYPDKEFVGLSINATGESSEAKIEDVLESAPEGAKLKLMQARDNGITSVRIVDAISEAVSCDLVTEAGAGGEVLKLLEAERDTRPDGEDVKTKSEDKMENETEKKEAAPEEKPEVAGGGEEHPDKAQDIELIKTQLRKYLGDEEPEESMEMAMEAFESYKEMGYQEDEALKCAAHAMKLAKHLAGKAPKEEAPEEKPEGEEKPAPKQAPEKEEEACEGECECKKEAKEEEAKKESKEEETKESDSVKLAGRVAFLEAQVKMYEMKEHLDKVCRESKLPMEITKKFKTRCEKAKTTKEIDDKFELFKEGLNARGGEADDMGFVFVAPEKKPATANKKSFNFGDCI